MSSDSKKYIARASRGSSTNTNNINTSRGRVYASILYTEQFLETETAPLCVRVPLKYKIIYKSMNTKQKQLFKLGVIALIEAIAGARGEGEAAQHSPVIVNVNINYNEVKPRQEVKIELSVLEELEEIIEYLKRLEQHNGTLYPQAIHRLRKRLETIRKKMSTN